MKTLQVDRTPKLGRMPPPRKVDFHVTISPERYRELLVALSSSPINRASLWTPLPMAVVPMKGDIARINGQTDHTIHSTKEGSVRGLDVQWMLILGGPRKI